MDSGCKAVAGYDALVVQGCCCVGLLGDGEALRCSLPEELHDGHGHPHPDGVSQVEHVFLELFPPRTELVSSLVAFSSPPLSCLM